MISASTKLLASLSKIDYWLPQTMGFHTVIMDKDDGRKSITAVTTEDVASLHPLLPQAILAISAHPDKVGRKDFISGHLVAYTLELLNGRYIEFTDMQGNKREFIKPSALSNVIPETTHVAMHGTYVDVRAVPLGGQQMHIAVNGYLSQTLVSKKDLELNSPGWEKRWLMAVDLGFSARECLPHVFFKPDTTPVLPGITFE